jgi:dihydroflavonol-4-reductase
VRELETAGHQARALVRRTSDLHGLAGTKAPLVYADITDAEDVRAAVREVDVVIHCAAIYSYWGRSADDLHRSNVDGTHVLLEACAEAGVGRFVVTSSSVTLGSADGPMTRDENDRPVPADETIDYYQSKQRQEATALTRGAELGLDVVVANPTVVVGGPDRRPAPSNAVLVRYLMDPLRTTFPGGCNIVSVRDVAAGHVLLAEHGRPGERYVLGGENWTWAGIHQAVSELCGTYGPGLPATRTSAYVAAAAHELLARLTGGTPSATRAEALTVGRYYWYRHDRAAALGYQPRPARQALAEAVGWLLTSPHVPSFVRAALRPHPEVYENRLLLPGPIPKQG